eukprot:CAMPEP_0118659460 /NCGR_PEP_ID=MMETSP0785-20121206/15123_1 /TAXON_ID=91992 /ORGANISM="Bolidomonas pacifica, Strain CCMP 1866" /LENGTH=116 /DNA_ID=CAMNT_0006552565 /DNA_START=118 /DNA_END=469 /DNA_ORIENTATION=+
MNIKELSDMVDKRPRRSEHALYIVMSRPKNPERLRPPLNAYRLEELLTVPERYYLVLGPVDHKHGGLNVPRAVDVGELVAGEGEPEVERYPEALSKGDWSMRPPTGFPSFEAFSAM